MEAGEPPFEEGDEAAAGSKYAKKKRKAKELEPIAFVRKDDQMLLPFLRCKKFRVADALDCVCKYTRFVQVRPTPRPAAVNPAHPGSRLLRSHTQTRARAHKRAY